MARTLEEIQQEYGSVCAKAGHCQYQIKTLEKDLAMINETLQKLNIEAFKAKEAAETTQPAAEEAVSS